MSERNIFVENRNLLLALLCLLILSNIPYGSHLLYPFELFSTWIHELCHGLACIAVGGYIDSLSIFADTSGRAYNVYHQTFFRDFFITSAGYLGTTLFGALLLLFQRPTSLSRGVGFCTLLILGSVLFFGIESWLGRLYYLALIGSIATLAFWTDEDNIGRVGTFCLGALMLLSLIFAKGWFTFVALLALGGSLIAASKITHKHTINGLFSFLAATCGFNALTGLQTLFSSQRVINGQITNSSDAHAVAKMLFGPAAFWAFLWMLLSLGILTWALFRTLTVPPKQTPESKTKALLKELTASTQAQTPAEVNKPKN